MSNEGDGEGVKTSVSCTADRRPYTDAVDGVTSAALHSGVEIRLENVLPDLPFIDAFNGVVSRRAVLKVSTLF